MLARIRSRPITVEIGEPTMLPTYLSLFDVLNLTPCRSGVISLSSNRLLGCRHLSDIPKDSLVGYLKNITRAQVEGRQVRLVFGLQGGPGPQDVDMDMSGSVNPAWRDAYLHLMVTWVHIDTDASSPQAALFDAAALDEDNKEAVGREWAPDTGAYVNEANSFTRDFQGVIYGDNYDRLLEIKEEYDPTASLYGFSGVVSDMWNYGLNSGLLCRVD